MPDFPLTLTKGDAVRTANTVADLVRFEFDGFTVDGDRPVAEAATALFDPADHTVAEVNAYLADADAAEHARVLSAEAAGKNRASLVG